MRHQYSNTIVYNSFPWPTPTDEQKSKIEQTTQAILDARAVMEAYGMPVKGTTESSCVAELMRRYLELTANSR